MLSPAYFSNAYTCTNGDAGVVNNVVAATQDAYKHVSGPYPLCGGSRKRKTGRRGRRLGRSVRRRGRKLGRSIRRRGRSFSAALGRCTGEPPNGSEVSSVAPSAAKPVGGVRAIGAGTAGPIAIVTPTV